MIKSIPSTKNKIMLYLFVSNILLLTVLLFWGGAGFESDDDFTLAGIVSGAQGYPSQYMIFCNILFGYLLKGLYLMIPAVNWYVIVQYLFIFGAFIAIGYVFIRKAGVALGGTAYSLFLLLFAKEIYITFNFTRTAALVSVAGFILIFYYLWNSKEEHICLGVLGGMLLLFGSFIRFKSFLMVAAFAFGFWLYEVFFSEKFDTFKNMIRTKVSYFILYGIIFAVIFSCWGIDQLVYQSNDEWNYYQQYNNVRSELFDFGLPDYLENAEKLQQLGITEEDYTMMNAWTFADPERLDLSTLQSIAEMKVEIPFSFGQIRNFIKQLYFNQFTDPLFCFGLISILVYLLLSKKRNYFLIIYTGFIGMAELFYLFYQGRTVARVLVGIYVCMACFTLLCFDKRNLRFKTKQMTNKGALAVLAGTTAIALLVCNTTYFGIKRTVSSPGEEPRKTMMELNQTNNLYLGDAYSTPYFPLSYNMFDTVDQNLFKNFYYLGGWTTFSPLTNERLAQHGVTNPFRALGERDDVFLVDYDNIESKAVYLRQHYFPDISWSVYGNFCSKFIISFTQNFQYLESMYNAEFLSASCKPIEGREPEYFWISGAVFVDEFDIQTDRMFIEVQDHAGNVHTYQVNPQELPQSPSTYQFCVGIAKTELPEQEELSVKAIIKNSEKQGYANNHFNVALE